MKKLIILLLSVLPFFAYSQVVDNFNDGDFTANPAWFGDMNSFNIENNQLHSNGPQSSSKIYLSTPNTMIDSTEWSFLIDLKFAPSSTNLVRIYLISSDTILYNATNAYYIEIGQSNQDSIKLFKKQNSITTLLFTGNTSFGTTITELKVRLKITRSSNGIWNIYSDKTGGTNFVSEGNTFADNSISSTSYFGVYCQYATSSRYNMYYFDDVYVGKIIPDTTKPFVSSLMVKSINSLDVLFSEVVDAISSQNIANYLVNNGIGNPVTVTKDTVNSSLIHLTFAQNFPLSGICQISIYNIVDLQGNIITPIAIPFAFNTNPHTNDILINEILFNPKDDGVDFVEIYNRSPKNIDLSKLYISGFDINTNKLKSMYLISSESKSLVSGDFLVMTTNPEKLKSQYLTEFPDKIIKLNAMPAFNNDMGIVVLSLIDSTVIDRFDYSETMHLPILTSVEGVSLERINSEKATQDKQNWHSAAQSVGFATPTYKNSQYSGFLYLENPITITPEIFSPDNDAYNDVLNINYQFDTPGYIANVIVYDSKGRFIKQLAKNELLATKGGFIWDGIDESNQKAIIGIYIIYIEVFDIKGNKKDFKKTAVLAGKF